MSQFRENLRTEGRTDGRTDRRMDGRSDRQTLFYRTLPAETGGLTRSINTKYIYTHNWGKSEILFSCPQNWQPDFGKRKCS